MTGPFKVYLNETPLTVDIADEKRAALAYNMMYSLAEDGAICTSDGNRMAMDEDLISVIDAEGNSFKPELDPEWYGSNEQEDQIYHSIVERTIENAKQQGEELDSDAATERMMIYSVMLCADGYHDVDLSPATWDREKAENMYNFMKYGIDPNASISISAVPITADDVCFSCLVDNENVFLNDEKISDPEWANTLADDGQGFTAAVASIPVNNKGLEQ